MSSSGELKSHCLRRPTSKTSVLFVHGILSGGEDCWLNKASGAYWPVLVKNEPTLDSVGVYVFSYRSDLLSRTYSISDAVDALREFMKLEDLWENDRIIFVCHSMGGIVVRRLLLTQQTQFTQRGIGIGLFLVASPSLGSHDANAVAVLAFLLGSSQAKALRFSQRNEWLADLDKDFRDLKELGRPRIEGKEIIEDEAMPVKKFFGLRRQVVEPFSGARYFKESLKIPYSDHHTIAKPSDDRALQHRVLCKFIEEVANPRGEPYLADVQQHETEQALRLLKELEAKLRTDSETKTQAAALAALHHALVETRRYLKQEEEGAQRDAVIERRLSELWSTAGFSMMAHDPEVATLCFVKGHGWADERIWSDPRYKDLPLRLDDILARLIYQPAARQGPGTAQEDC